MQPNQMKPDEIANRLKENTVTMSLRVRERTNIFFSYLAERYNTTPSTIAKEVLDSYAETYADDDFKEYLAKHQAENNNLLDGSCYFMNSRPKARPGDTIDLLQSGSPIDLTHLKPEEVRIGFSDGATHIIRIETWKELIIFIISECMKHIPQALDLLTLPQSHDGRSMKDGGDLISPKLIPGTSIFVETNFDANTSSRHMAKFAQKIGVKELSLKVQAS